jgi:RimJ/RimL family protein N-acetyltransferase
VLDYAFHRVGLEKVKLRTFKHNLRAQRAFKKAGFRVVGVAPATGVRLSSGVPREDVLMEITKEEWDEGTAS